MISAHYTHSVLIHPSRQESQSFLLIRDLKKSCIIHFSSLKFVPPFVAIPEWFVEWENMNHDGHFFAVQNFIYLSP